MNTEIKPHLKVVQHPNSKCRTFHVTREVCYCRHYGFGRDDTTSSLFKNEEPGEEARQLAKFLGDMPGVTSGNLRQYEVSVVIGDAFSWKDIGPLVIGQIVQSVYPEVVGGTLEVSATIGWSYYVRPNSSSFMGEDDDGHRTHYEEMADHQPVEVSNFGVGRPTLNIEHLLGKDVLQEAKQKKAAETVFEE